MKMSDIYDLNARHAVAAAQAADLSRFEVREELTADIAKAFRSISNEEAGEAATVGKIVAMIREDARETKLGDWVVAALAATADSIERGDWRSTPIPAVNGTDEPPTRGLPHGTD